eukprot:CAMPEP_0178488828 /NCGR_PEP_ID=MMETSP0696-20121128/10061_1 /TAXON_ID=265572 /ORGANISM="Extubocellulus spinifer, Strain CCMP396" /LENGTH=69 /DNA_ID=CAMNT_0020116609 /DNA_START=275 /DNA_END=484 /DNA_ORIENTATION=+
MSETTGSDVMDDSRAAGDISPEVRDDTKCVNLSDDCNSSEDIIDWIDDSDASGLDRTSLNESGRAECCC